MPWGGTEPVNATVDHADIRPYLCPSGAFLDLGTSVCFRLLTSTRVTPKPGLRLCRWPEALWVGYKIHRVARHLANGIS